MSVLGKFEPTKVEFRWKIENFSSLMKNTSMGTSMMSPDFVTSWTDFNDPKWKLQIYPAGETEEWKDYVGLHLHYYGKTELTVVGEFSVFDETGKIMFGSRCMSPHVFRNGNSWGFKCFLEKTSFVNESKNTFGNDTVIICCTIFVPNSYGDGIDDKTSAFDYFEELLESGKYTDVKFMVGRKGLLLHKAILTSISPVFQAMFEHEMKEKKENVVKITDIKYNVALEMFRYIYCRKVNDIDAIAEDLLVAADKYSITGLQTLCEKSIISGLKLENVLKCLLLVTKYETTHLKSKVIEFITSHIKELIGTPEYNELDMQCKDEIIKALANK